MTGSFGLAQKWSHIVVVTYSDNDDNKSEHLFFLKFEEQHDDETMITISWWKQSQVLVSAPHGVHQDLMHLGLDNDVDDGDDGDDAPGGLEKERGDDHEDNDGPGHES